MFVIKVTSFAIAGAAAFAIGFVRVAGSRNHFPKIRDRKGSRDFRVSFLVGVAFFGVLNKVSSIFRCLFICVTETLGVASDSNLFGLQICS